LKIQGQTVPISFRQTMNVRALGIRKIRIKYLDFLKGLMMKFTIFMILASILFAAEVQAGQTFKAYTADLELQVRNGWIYDDTVSMPSPKIPVRGAKCANSIWFDFIPGSNLEYTRKLIDTETIEVTAAVRQWHERKQSLIQIGGHSAAKLALPFMPDRTIFIIPVAGGSLVIQTLANGEKALEKCTPLHTKAAEELVSLFFTPDVIRKAEYLSKTLKPPAPQKLDPVPANIEECFIELKRQLSKQDLEKMRLGSEDMIEYHFGLGTGLRNSWGLWSGAPLAKYFNTLGVFHPDDMSGIILKSFWRHLNSKPLEIEKQAAWYKRYWDLRKQPEPKTCSNGKSARHLFFLEDGSRDNERVVHIFVCKTPITYWVWELDRGWYSPDEKLKRRIVQLRREAKTGESLISAPLDE
jgi:hypothetical protein